MRSPALSTYSQQLWVIAKLSTDNSDGNFIAKANCCTYMCYLGCFADEIFDKSFQVNVCIEGLTEEHKPIAILESKNSRNRY